MIYVFDTSSLSKLKHFFPGVFKSVWTGLDALAKSGDMISTREVWNEIARGDVDLHTNKWLKDRKQIFTTPTADEQRFVAQIFQIPHFQSLIGEKQRLTGTPVADPFIIACAKVHKGTVVTEERLKPNAAKIPNVCEHPSISVPCIDLETFMKKQGWSF
ncbi:MAG: PIN domain-containing protein [Ramlibacter sp.]